MRRGPQPRGKCAGCGRRFALCWSNGYAMRTAQGAVYSYPGSWVLRRHSEPGEGPVRSRPVCDGSGCEPEPGTVVG